MALSLPKPDRVSGSLPSIVKLIPWDPDSEEHIQRMILQRKACGWKHEHVRSWAKMQKEADISLFWLVVEDEEKINQHCSQYPQECSPLLNSATQIGGSTLLPPHTPFTPIGHIALDSSHPDYPSMANKSQGLYSVSRFYVSDALQSSGIGRAAMDALELMAQGEPIDAKALTLSTIANEFEGRDERLKAQGRTRSKLSLEDWYARRGYVIFGRLDAAWEEVDSTGKTWPCTAVFMRKELTGVEEK